MTEVGANGTSSTAIDFTSTKADLSSSSTRRRVAQLKTIDEAIRGNCELYYIVPLPAAQFHARFQSRDSFD
jgi:hypothetical protein